MKQKIYRIHLWCLEFLLVQLFITLFTWPFLLCWGLPITPLSIVGNCIFTPFLTFFLLLSSLITVGELCALPTSPLLDLLELTTALWLWIVEKCGYNCGMTFVQPSLIILALAPLAAVASITAPVFSSTYRKIGALASSYSVIIVLLMLQRQPLEIKIPYGNNWVTVTRSNNQYILTDPGFARRTSSINTWINYTLLPALGKNFGVQTINALVLQKKNPSALKCAEALKNKKIVRITTS